MPELQDFPFDIGDGYWPSASQYPPPELWRTIRNGQNVWLRPGARLIVANGVAQTSSTNVGARIFPLNQYRAEIAGALVSSRLPYAGLIRYQNAVLFFLSELTGQQVYVNESTSTPFNLTGVTTASSAGVLRIAVPNGSGGFNTYDAGFAKPGTGTVTTPAGGTKGMTGTTGVALAPWRSATNAIGPPSEITYATLTLGAADQFSIALPATVSGQDGWIFCGTRWGDQSGDIRIVRFVYITPRGTFTATNGSPNLTAGVGTFWNRDLRAGDVVTIDGGSYTISAVTSDTTATLTANFTGGTGAGKTMTVTTAVAEWYNGELGSLIDRDAQKPPKAAGVFQFAGRVFLWGCYGEGSGLTGPAIVPMLEDNPEHVGLHAILTSQGDDIVNVLAGDQTLFVMTANTLELVTFTGDPANPYKIRAYDGLSGFRAAMNGTVYKNRFYGYSQRPFRTVTDGDIDVEFGQPVADAMAGWDGANVVVLVDPIKEAVLFCRFEAAIPPASEGITTCIPYMPQLGKWGVPILVTGQVTDGVINNGQLYLVVVTSSGNYRVQTWEGGTGLSNPYIETQSWNDVDRWKVKGVVFAGRADMITLFSNSPAGATAEVFTISLSPGANQYPEIFTNTPPARAVFARINFPSSDGTFERLTVRAYPLAARR